MLVPDGEANNRHEVPFLDGFNNLVREKLESGLDDEAWRSILRLAYGDLMRFASSLLFQSEHSEDVLQESLVTFVADVNSKDLKDPKALLCCVIRCRAIDRNKKVVRERKAITLVTDSKASLPDQEPDYSELEEVLSELGADCQALIELKFRKGFTFPEIAKIFGKSESTMKKSMMKCLAFARKAFEKLGFKKVIHNERR